MKVLVMKMGLLPGNLNLIVMRIQKVRKTRYATFFCLFHAMIVIIIIIQELFIFTVGKT